MRTHVLRPTWHFVAPDDLRWLLALSAPRLQRRDAHRLRALEIDADLATRAVLVFERAIAKQGPLTRQELRGALADAGIEAQAGRLAHLVMHAELEAVICSGPRKGAAHTYALVDERVPSTPPRSRDEALADLAGRYVTGHGPAQDVDLAWWSGLSVGESRRGLVGATGASGLDREVIGERTFWFASGKRGPASAADPSRTEARFHLLPNYDELLVAFRDRSDALHPDMPAPSQTSEAISTNVIVRDGIVVGRWQRQGRSVDESIGIDVGVGLDSGDRARLSDAVRRHAVYLGRSVAVTGLD